MTKKRFWQSASNRGFLGGAALFGMNIVGWALKLEAGAGTWLYELLLFAVICPLIITTGRRNAELAGAEGYSYARALGYVFALMMFAGIVYGAGRFLMTNFIAREYYDALNADALETVMKIYRGTPMESQAVAMQDNVLRAMSNPFVLIVSSIINFVIKGGLLGLFICVFLKKNPDIFAAAGGDDNER